MSKPLIEILERYSARYRGAPEPHYQNEQGEELEAAAFQFPSEEHRVKAKQALLENIQKRSLQHVVLVDPKLPRTPRTLHLVGTSKGRELMEELRERARRL